MPSFHEGPSCNWCGTALTRHQSVTTRSCGAAGCERQRLAALARSEARRHRDDHDQLINRMRKQYTEVLKAAAKALKTDAAALQVAVVPHNSKPLVPLPADRRTAFQAHLEKIAAEGFAIERPEIHASHHMRRKIDLPEAHITDAACATCQGDCCKAGGPSWGFTDETTVCRYRVSHPDADIEDFCAYYLEQLPVRSVEGNCVFQSATGCTLSRKDRADLCNSFLCRGVNRVLEQHAAEGAKKTAIVARSDGNTCAIGLYDPASQRLEGVLNPAAVA